MIKSFAILSLFAIGVYASAADTPTPADDTVSVLSTTETAKAVEPAPAPVAAAVEAARVVNLPAWQVRRLNRVADRQEARAERQCCCKESCGDSCCKSKVLVVEARSRCNCK